MVPPFFSMFGFNSKPPKLTEEKVRMEEQRAQDAQEQLALMKRYSTARGKRRITEAETGFIYRLGEAVTMEQVRALKSTNPIRQARQQSRTAAQARLNAYTQKLLNRGSGNE